VTVRALEQGRCTLERILDQGLCEEVELIGTKEGEGCMEGEGGGGIVVEGGYGGEGRRKEDTTAWPTSFWLDS
jgi:hypothetical protein